MSAKHADKNNEEKLEEIKEETLEEELIELEFDEDSVEYYIEDEQGNEVGVCLLEDGKQVEYYYEGNGDVEYEEVKSPNVDEQKPEPSKLQKYGSEVADSLKETKDELMDCKEDIGVVATELAKTAFNLKDTYQGFISGLNPINNVKQRAQEEIEQEKKEAVEQEKQEAAEKAKPAEKPAAAEQEKPAEKPAAAEQEKPAEKPAEKPVDKPAEKSADKAAAEKQDKAAAEKQDKPAEKPAAKKETE